jgi:DNA-3-methyladenine glycosylase I
MDITGPAPAPDSGERVDRCPWATGPWLIPYHDTEWGVETHDDRHHFEHLILEGAQAGLSWLTVLKRRDGYRRAFDGFDPTVVAGFGPDDVARLMADAGIIRNRAKIESTIGNAGAFLAVQEEFGSFDAYLRAHVLHHAGSCPLVNRWEGIGELPATTPMSEALSKDLRRRGFRFVGPIVCYSHLQAVGLINDHLVTCFRHAELAGHDQPDTRHAKSARRPDRA